MGAGRSSGFGGLSPTRPISTFRRSIDHILAASLAIWRAWGPCNGPVRAVRAGLTIWSKVMFKNVLASGRGARFRPRPPRRRRRSSARTRRLAAPGGEPACSSTSTASRARTGNIRVALYGSDPAALPRSAARRLRKVNLPVTRGGPMRVCVAVPGAGPLCGRGPPRRRRQRQVATGATAAASRATRASSLTNLRPRYENVAVNVGRGVHAGQRRAQLPLRPLHPPGPG